MAEIAMCVSERLELLAGIEDVSVLNPVELVLRGLCDPVRLFIKDEPHSLRKVSEGRFRLISNVSLVDQIIERFLFSAQNITEIEQYSNIPSKPGMGLHDDGIAVLLDNVKQSISPLAEADISAWDWSVQEWELMADAARRIRMYGLSASSVASRLILNRTRCLARKVFVLSDGTMYSQNSYGIQASGSYNTSSTNSWIRAYVAHLIGSLWVITMGDDSIESVVDNAIQKYSQYGHTCKNYDVTSPDDFEFCSMRFIGGTAYPVNQWKSMFKLLSTKVCASDRYALLVQWTYEYRHHPDLGKLLAFIISLDFLE